MWIQTLFFLLCAIYVSGSSDVTIRIDIKLVGPDGENCQTDSYSGLTKCTVQAGKTVRVTGTWVFKGPEGQGISELLCTDKFEGVNKNRGEANVCQKAHGTGNIVYNGSAMMSCNWDPISQGSFQQDPYKTTAPTEQGEKKFTITCHAKWTDKSKTPKIEVASVIAVVN